MPKDTRSILWNNIPQPVFVTGAAGFIGRRLVNRLLEEGVNVVAFDLLACPESLCDSDLVNWVQGDITVKADVKLALKGCQSIFHLAAMVGDWGQETLHRSVTVEGTRYVFESAAEYELLGPVVLASSIVVYGDQIDRQRCHEGLSMGATFGPYSKCKQAQEGLAQSFLQQGLDIRTVRPANVYGAGSKPWVETLSAELRRGIPCLIGGGDFDAGLVHVDNVVEILWLVARFAGAKGQIYNAADEEGITWKRYMSDLAKICDAPVPRSIPRLLAKSLAQVGETGFGLLNVAMRPPLTFEALNLVGSCHRIDMEKSKRELGYQVQTTYREGLAEVGAYLQGD
jgi:nucleoside-diphosphate-sugar epimerase